MTRTWLVSLLLLTGCPDDEETEPSEGCGILSDLDCGSAPPSDDDDDDEEDSEGGGGGIFDIDSY